MKLTDITVTVKPVITVDDETAYVLLNLLELYCNANRKTVSDYFVEKEDGLRIGFQFEGW